MIGWPTWARTRDKRINSPLLYQLSYRPKKMAEHVGIEPTHPLLSDRLAICCLNRSANAPVAGDKGLEPLNGGIKIRCLTNLANPQQKLLI